MEEHMRVLFGAVGLVLALVFAGAAVAGAAPVDGEAILGALRAHAGVQAAHCTDICVRHLGFRCVAVKWVCHN
jgi:hypothetical protein